jgi:hypothetical protein
MARCMRETVATRIDFLYQLSMNASNGRSAKGAPVAPKAPTDQPVNQRPPTPMERWYLECLQILAKHYRRPPTLQEIAHYCNRTHSPVWLAMRSLVAKGYVRQIPKSKRYEAIP